MVSEWRNAHIRPAFRELVRLAQAARIELVSYLLGQPSVVDDQSELVSRRPQRKGMDWPVVERLMHEMARADEPKPLSYLIGETGHDRKTLRQRYPAETSAMRQRFEEARAQKAVARRAEVERQVAEAVARLRDQNVRPSRRALEAELPGLSVREEAVRSAWINCTT